MPIAHVNIYQFIPLPHLTLDSDSLSYVGTGPNQPARGLGDKHTTEFGASDSLLSLRTTGWMKSSV